MADLSVDRIKRAAGHLHSSLPPRGGSLGKFLLRPQSTFGFPAFRQCLTPRNLLWSHLSFRYAQLVLIKIQIVFGGQPQPHIGLDRVARKLALQIRLTQKHLSVLVALLGGQVDPSQSFRDIPVRQQVPGTQKELRFSVALHGGLSEPLVCLIRILWDSLAFQVHLPKEELSVWIALLRERLDFPERGSVVRVLKRALGGLEIRRGENDRANEDGENTRQ